VKGAGSVGRVTTPERFRFRHNRHYRDNKEAYIMTVHTQARAARVHTFVAAHPDGWNHADWEGLVGELRAAGLLDQGEEAALGRELERERVLATLTELAVPGLGPKRREAIAAHCGRLWDLKHVSVDDLAALPSIPRGLAEAVRTALR